ncbi:MAG: DNA polymerase III subunit gamma/tau, partial [Pseudomonadota bacterium]
RGHLIERRQQHLPHPCEYAHMQMLLKALDEVAAAPNAMMAAEMAVIRLTHVADLPTPEDLVRRIQEAPAHPAVGAPSGGGVPPSGPAGRSETRPPAVPDQPTGQTGFVGAAGRAGRPGPATAQATSPEIALAHYNSFDRVVDLIRSNRDVKLLVDVETGVRLVSYSPGRIEFSPTSSAPADLSQRLGGKLQSWTGNRWAIILSNEGGAPSIAELRDAQALKLQAEAEETEMIRAVRAHFPKARILDIRSHAQISAEAESEALPEVSEEWDPFDDA